MTFVVIGGGPTGVEMAGAIAELAKRALASDFRAIDPRCARIVLVEAAPRVLTPFDEKLSEAARRSLEQLGVEVRLGAAVTDCSSEGVRLGGDFIPARTIIWAAGVMASPAGRWLGAETDRAGRVKVRADLSLPGHPDVFVIGDTAAVVDASGAMLPGVAPVAKQQGQYVARALIARREGRTVEAFRYRDYGLLATIGRSARGGANGQAAHRRVSGLGAVERRPHLFPDRVPQPLRRRAQLGVELHHVSARQPPDHWTGRASRGHGATTGLHSKAS